jgi:hypothetical protein
VNSGHESTRLTQLKSKFTFNGGRPRQVVAACKGVLQDLGEPLTRGQLTAELEARGKLHLAAKDKETRARYVGTILWRNPR